MFNRTVFAGIVFTMAITLSGASTSSVANKPVQTYKQSYLQGVRILKDCTGKKGVPFRYVASAIYTEASGAHATHVVYRDLYC